MAIFTEIDGVKIQRTQSDFATRQRAGEDHGLDFDGLPNPNPILIKLGKDIEVAEEILSDVRVKAARRKRKAAITGLEWDLMPQKKEDTQVTPQEHIDILKPIFESYNMRNTLSDLMNAPAFGYQPFQINWAIVNGLTLPVGNPRKGTKGLVSKPARWFRYDEHNELKFRPDQGGLVDIPQNRFIVARNDPTYDNPYGESYLLDCFWPATFRKNGWSFWSIFLEKFGTPFIKAFAREGAKKEEIEATASGLASMVSDGIIVMPKGWEAGIETIQFGNASAHEGYISAAATDISIAILSSNLTIEVKGGSFAAAETHKEGLEDLTESDNAIAETMMNELIARVYAMNPWDPSVMPKFKLFSKEKVNIDLATRDEKLKKAFPNLELNEQYFIDNYNLDKKHFTLNSPVTSNIDANNRIEQV